MSFSARQRKFTGRFRSVEAVRERWNLGGLLATLLSASFFTETSRKRSNTFVAQGLLIEH